MSRALPGEHYCLAHQGNHSHYAEHNCRVCTAELERDNWKWNATESRRVLADAIELMKAATKDAERYRWLRENGNVDCCVDSCYGEIDGYLGEDTMDAAVDAARHSAP